MKFNINNYVTVTLTQIGADIYNSRWDGLKIPPNHIPPKVEAGHILKAQLWTIFEDFGPHIHMGFEMPFEGCILEFYEKDFE